MINKLFILTALVILFAGCNSDKKSKEKETQTAQVGSSDQALKALEEEIKLNPNNPVLLHKLAKLYIERKRYQDAFNEMRRVMELDPTKSEYFLTMADLSFVAKHTYEAKGYLETALELDPDNTEAMMRLAELNLIVKQYTESVQLLNKVLAKDKTSTTAWFMRGINFKENGDTNRAVNDFRSAVEVDPEYYNAFMQLGMIFQLRNDPISEGYFNNAIRIRPNSEEALYGRGLWYQEHEQLDKAIQDYTTIVQINPYNKNAHFNLGYIHQIYLKVYSEAIKHYGRAIEADFQYTEAFYNRGLCYEAVGNLDAAESDFKSAIGIRPQYPSALEGLKRVSK